MKEVFEKIIERLEEEKDVGYVHGYHAGRNDAFDDAIEIINQLAEEYGDGWIPCSKKLPERNKNVLCWAKSTARGGDVCFVGSCDNGFWFLPTAIGTLGYPTQYDVVAWQPLPEHYQPNLCASEECPAWNGCGGYEPKGE